MSVYLMHANVGVYPYIVTVSVTVISVGMGRVVVVEAWTVSVMVSKGTVTFMIIVDAGPNVVMIFVIVVSIRLVDATKG